MNGKEAISSILKRALSPSERQVLMLFYAEDLSTSEIAMVLDLSERVVVTTLLRLRNLVRDLMARSRSPALA